MRASYASLRHLRETHATLRIMQMHSISRDLSPIFRSETQFKLLGELFVDLDRQWTIGDLAERIDSSASAVSREVDRLAATDLVTATRSGNQRMVAANMASPIAEDLRRLLVKSYGPAPTITRLLRTVPGIEEALIFGSWAARAAGEPGPPPHDVDLLVIGQMAPLDVYEVARAATQELGIEVNPVVRTRQEWDDDRTEFARAVREGTTVDVTPAADNG